MTGPWTVPSEGCCVRRGRDLPGLAGFATLADSLARPCAVEPLLASKAGAIQAFKGTGKRQLRICCFVPVVPAHRHDQCRSVRSAARIEPSGERRLSCPAEMLSCASTGIPLMQAHECDAHCNCDGHNDRRREVLHHGDVVLLDEFRRDQPGGTKQWIDRLTIAQSKARRLERSPRSFIKQSPATDRDSTRTLATW